jgi:anti-anti-sigma factor
MLEAKIDSDTLLITSLGWAGGLALDEMLLELAGLLDEFEQSRLKHAVIDLEKSSYFGTSMLQAMTAIWKRVRAAGGKMAICNVSDMGREILHVTKFDTLWPICPSQREALGVVGEA